MPNPLELTPLAAVNPEALTALFEADPQSLTDEALHSLILELRRRRNAFTAEEAAKASKSVKPKSPRPTPTAAEAAIANVPPVEVNLEDLL